MDRNETLALPADVVIELQGFDGGGSPTLVKTTREGFEEAFRSRFSEPQWYGGKYFEIVASGGAAVELTQIYLP